MRRIGFPVPPVVGIVPRAWSARAAEPFVFTLEKDFPPSCFLDDIGRPAGFAVAIPRGAMAGPGLGIVSPAGLFDRSRRVWFGE